MFTPANIRRPVTQKSRNTSRGNLTLINPAASLTASYNSITALSSGFLHTRCLELFYTHIRKLLGVTKRSVKFWLNLHACHLVTRKALNVRMGKGKGSRIGINARISAGNRIVGISFCRPGL